MQDRYYPTGSATAAEAAEALARADARDAAEAEVREFCAEFGSLPNVARMLAACEAGTVRWDQARTIARTALASGIQAARDEA